MSDPVLPDTSVIVVTGANGLVGSHVCAALAERGARVRAVVRRRGSAPELPGVEEYVGDFTEPDVAAAIVDGADVVVSTAHPLGSDRASQQAVSVEATPALARAARDAGVALLVHVSTAAVYDRSAGVGDVDASSALVGDDAGDYPVSKRDTDAALEEVGDLTRVVVRPPVILGPGESSLWNTRRPARMREDRQARSVNPEQSFAWVHVDDLAALIADVATGHIAPADDAERGPVEGRLTAVNVAGGPATARDYYGTVARALGVEPVWHDDPAWTGQVLADRAQAWGWKPTVDLEQALDELAEGLGGQRD